MKVKLITCSNHELPLREIAYLLNGKAETELYNLSSQDRFYSKKTLENITQYLTKEPADLYLFSVRELERLRSFQVADELRKRGFKTIVGGTYVFSNIKESHKHFDTVVVGDAKNALDKILDGQMGVIEGGVGEPEIESYDILLFYLEKGRIKKSSSGLRPLKHPQYKQKNELSFTTQRGCSQSCPYCEVAQLRKIFPNYELRKKPLEKVLDYVKEKTKEINPDYIHIWDEDFLLHSNYEIDKFVELYKEIEVPFFIFATPKTVIHRKDKLKKLALVGLNQVNIGVQSGSERIQKELFGRKESLREGREATKFLVELHKDNSETMDPPMIDFITLNPYEKNEDICASINYALDLLKPFNLVAHIMNFFEGTPLKEDALRKGFINSDYSFDYDLHDFVNHARDARRGRRKNSPENIYLSSILFRMNGINNREKHGMITCDEVNHLLSEEKIPYNSSNIDNLIEEMEEEYNPPAL